MEATSRAYVKDQTVLGDAVQFDAAFMTEGARQLGYDKTPTVEGLRTWADGLRPDGTPCLRVQKNQNKSLYGQVYTNHWTVSEWFSRQDVKRQQEIMGDWMQSVWYGHTEMNHKVGFIRHGAQGKNVEKANLSGVALGHAWSSAGDPHLHAHVFYQTYGVAPTGETRSLYNKTKFFSVEKEASLHTQLSWAAKLEDKYGLKVTMENNRVVIPALQENLEARRLVGKRRQEMVDFLREKSLPITPANMAYARVETRPKQRPQYTKEERAYHWQQQAKQVDYSNLLIGQKEQGGSGTWAKVFHTLWTAGIKAPAAVVGLAFKRAYFKRRQKLIVTNVDEFLRDIRKKSVLEGHKAAYRALLRRQVGGLNEALDVAEAAYKAGRKPRLKLPKGTKIHLTDEARKNLTDEQAAALAAVAKRYRLVIPLQNNQQQKQGY